MLEKINRLSKRILEYVNLAVQECENSHRLYELQRRLDKRPLENIPEFEEFKVSCVSLCVYSRHHHLLMFVFHAAVCCIV